LVQRSKLREAAASLIVGIASGFSFANHFLNIWSFRNRTRAMLLLVLTIIFGFLVYWLIKCVLKPHIITHPPIDTIFWVFIALVSGFAISAIPGVTHFPPSWHTLNIITTGEKNTASSGSQVWLAKYYYGGQILSLEDCKKRGDWQTGQYNLQGLFSDDASQAVLTCQFFGSDSLEVILKVYTQPAGGIVLLQMDSNQMMVDLYSSSEMNQDISLQPSSPLIWKILLHGADSIAIGFCILLIKIFYEFAFSA